MMSRIAGGHGDGAAQVGFGRRELALASKKGSALVEVVTLSVLAAQRKRKGVQRFVAPRLPCKNARQ